MITGYFMAPCRGQDGDSVDHDVKWDNVEFAQQVGQAIEGHFPSEIDLYIPHDNEEFVEAAMELGLLTSTDVLKIFCAIAVKKDLSVCYRGHGISPGMELELEARKDMPNIMVDELNAEAIEKIALKINEVRQCLSGQQ